MNRLFASRILAAALLLSCARPLAAGGEAEARKLLLDAETRHRTKSQEYAGELSVVSKDGKVRKKGWKSWREGYAGDARQLIRFVDPPEVRGVGFLSLSHTGKNADQWLYLPSMKRERRIASQDRDASFVGTDFNYEDMEEFDQARYDVSLLSDETLEGQPCTMIEATPRERSIYERKKLALRKDLLLLVRVESFRKGEQEPAKRLVLSDVHQVDAHWVARKLEMHDLKKGSRTTVLLKELAFDRAQPADRFTLQNLDREE
ncbi:MAG: outer membrane lipoprotein-sorting protein [Thermoanaerobaculia bacterium]